MDLSSFFDMLGCKSYKVGSYMRKIKSSLSLIILMALTAVMLVGPTGCGKTTLSTNGVYHGDVFLYNTEKAIVTANGEFQKFLHWEFTYRSILPAEVSQAADFIRKNEKTWEDTANALHDAYVATPTADNKDKLTLALNLISTGLDQAATYMAAQKTNAPNAGVINPLKPQP